MAVNPNAAPWKELPAAPWGVYYKHQQADGVAEHFYAAFDKSADEKAGQPFTRADAERLAENINANTGELVAVAIPLEQTLQPGD